MPLRTGLTAPNTERIQCAFYRLLVRDRFTKEAVCDLSDVPVAGTFSFALRSTESFEFTMETSEGCCDCYPTAWKDELVIQRLNASLQLEGEIWCGTITRKVPDTINDLLTITALDNTIWWTRSPQAQRAINGPLEQADLWAILVADMERLNPSGLVIPPSRATGQVFTGDISAGTTTIQSTSTTTETRPDGTVIVTETSSEGTTITDATALIFGGLDAVQWTSHGCRIYGPGPDTVGEEPYATLDVDKHWADAGAVIDDDGGFVTTQATVIGRALDGSELIGVFPPNDPGSPVYGIHRPLPVQNNALTTQAQVDAEAREIYERDKDGNIFLVSSSNTLTKDAPVTPWELIPGRRFYVVSNSGCIEVNDLRQLNNVVIEVGPARTSQGLALKELRVAIDLGPVGVDRASQDRVSI